MSQYVFILGREPQLSLAEINVQLAQWKLSADWLSVTPFYAVVQADLPLDFFDRLAGTVKIGLVIAEIDNAAAPVKGALKDFLMGNFSTEYLFGFSWYGRRVPRWLNRLGLILKKELSQSGQRARYVVSRQSVLSSVVVEKNHLLPPRGLEFIFLPHNNKLWLARTLKVQNFIDWSKRDYGRPARAARVGMLPPKLARLMINLSGSNQVEPLLDPFCGSGTVLQEAALLGYTQLWGSDLDKAGIDRTRRNLDWLRSQRPINFTYQAIVADARRLSTAVSARQFGAVVTEPYLGPPLKGQVSPDKLKRIQDQLTVFYKDILQSLYRVIKPGGSLVMVWPAWRLKNGQLLTLPLLQTAHKLGFKEQQLLPPAAPVDWHNLRGSYLYHRPEQYVAREIWVFKK